MTLHITPQERRAHSALIRKHKDRLPKRIPSVSRERIEQAIEAHMEQADRLIRVLDLYDGDAADYEPALGSNGSCHSPERDDQSFWAYCTRDEREVDVADEPHDEMDEGNHEPSLAHTNDFNQEQARRHIGTLQIGETWIQGSEDLEAEHDGREPSLGAPEANLPVGTLPWANMVIVGGGMDQTGWGHGPTHAANDELEVENEHGSAEGY